MTISTPGLFHSSIALASLRDAVHLFQQPTALVVERRNTIPVLSCVQLHSGDDCVTVRGTDMDMALYVECPSRDKSTGAVNVNAKALYDTLKQAKGDAVEVQDTGTGTLVLTFQNGSTARLKTDNGEFPLDMPLWNVADHVTVRPYDALQLASDLKLLAPCVSTEETRYYLNGVAWQVDAQNAKLKLIATNGHMLGQVSRDIGNGLPDDTPDIILPRKAANWLSRVSGKHGETISIGYNASKFMVKYGRIRFYSKVIDGTFPDVSRVIPQKGGNTFAIDAKDLVREAKAVSAHLDGRVRGITLSGGADFITLVGNSPDNGLVSAFVDGTFKPIDEGEEFAAGYNAGYLQALVKPLGKQGIVIDAQSSDGPALISVPNQPELTYVIMPMRIDSATVYSPARLARLDRNPLQVLETDGPKLAAQIEQMPTTALRKELGELMRAAVEFSNVNDDRAHARHLVKKLFAIWTGGPTPEQALQRRAAAAKAKQAALTPQEVEIVPDAAEPEPVAVPQPQCDNPRFRTMQEFKAAAGVGSLWLIESYAPDAGWRGAREREIVTVRARSIGMMDPNNSDETKRRVGGASGGGERSWFEFPPKDMWHSTETAFVRTFDDGTPCIRFTPIEAEAPAATPANDLESRVAALEALLRDKPADNSHLVAQEPLTISASDEGANVKRTPAHARSIQRAWDERRKARAAAKRIDELERTMATVASREEGLVSERRSAERARDVAIERANHLANTRSDHVPELEAANAKLNTRVKRLSLVNEGRKRQVALLGEQLMVARKRAAENVPLHGDKVTAIPSRRVVTYPEQAA